jgi:SMODS-associating 4TM effector domain
MNNIPQEQNTHQRVELLAAQRQLYSDAKNLQMVSVIISIPVVIVWSSLVAGFPELAVYSALWGFIATFLELLIFSRLQKSTQEKAAKIQQMFDCEVLQFNWASLNCGDRVEPETIIDASSRYRRKQSNFSKLLDWYPISAGQLPIHYARIICQRSNVWWDAQLRRRYSKWILFALFVLTVFVLLFGLIGGLTLEKLVLAVLNPLTPAFIFGLRQYTEHNEAALRLDRLREKAEALFQEAISKRFTPQDLDRESYSLQTQIYDNRRLSPLIFDCVYSRLKNEDEEKMNKGAESLVQELIQNP